MAYIINITNIEDARGKLIVVEDLELPFAIKRVYAIINPKGIRGGHRHKQTVQAMICLSGSCIVYNNDGKKEQEFLLDDPTKCLILEPKDWHQMKDFSANCVLQILASRNYDIDDYIDETY